MCLLCQLAIGQQDVGGGALPHLSEAREGNGGVDEERADSRTRGAGSTVDTGRRTEEAV